MAREITAPSAAVLERNLRQWEGRPMTRKEIADLVRKEAKTAGHALTDRVSSRVIDLLMKYQRNGMRVSSDVISTVLSKLA